MPNSIEIILVSRITKEGRKISDNEYEVDWEDRIVKLYLLKPQEEKGFLSENNEIVRVLLGAGLLSLLIENRKFEIVPDTQVLIESDYRYKIKNISPTTTLYFLKYDATDEEVQEF